ncbi:hypothetical protein, partial [Mycobacterium kiyosense]|uniref:hypothetical protein n=1 Tax=Mycobacterium kiyosense TaxID=2871094 RepID=UPI002231215C
VVVAGFSTFGRRGFTLDAEASHPTPKLHTQRRSFTPNAEASLSTPWLHTQRLHFTRNADASP